MAVTNSGGRPRSSTVANCPAIECRDVGVAERRDGGAAGVLDDADLANDVAGAKGGDLVTLRG